MKRTTSVRSLINIRKRSGPNIEPCGTPARILHQLFGSDLSPFLYIGVTFACFQIFGTFLRLIVALNSFSNVGAMTSFSGFRISGPNALFTLSNDNEQCLN